MTGQLGDGTNNVYSRVPVQVSGLTCGCHTGFQQGYVIIIVRLRMVWRCVGGGNGRRTARGRQYSGDSVIPVQVSGLSEGVTAISAGRSFIAVQLWVVRRCVGVSMKTDS